MNNEMDKKTSENIPEENHEKKQGLFSKMKKGAFDFAKKTGTSISDNTKKFFSAIQDKVEDAKEKSAENKALKQAFEQSAKKYTIVFKDKTKINKQILCIVDEINHILKTDFEITLPNDIECIQDCRKQGYYNIFIKSEKEKFIHSYNNKELSMDLYQITYTNEKPKQNLYQTYNIVDNRVDNSINAGKGAIVGDNNSADKGTSLNIGLNIPKK